MTWGRTWVVARREWRATVLRREFLLMTFGLPLLFLALFGIVGAGSAYSVLHEAHTEQRASSLVGISDPGHVLDSIVFTHPLEGTQYRRVFRLQDAEAQVAAGRLRSLLIVPPDYLRTGALTVYRKASGGLFGEATDRSSSSFSTVLRVGLVGHRLPTVLAQRVIHLAGDSGATVLEWDARHHRFQSPDPFQEVSRFLVPYLFSLLLLMTILLGTGYLLHGIIDEKENRVMEILLSSVSHEELLRGKLIGLGGAGLTQMGVWGLMGGLPALLILPHLPTSFRIAPGTFFLALVLFVLGFLFYGSLMAAFGSLSSSWRESQQVTSLVVVLAMIPIMLLPVILESPNGVPARVLSWFPPTAPFALMLRTTAGTVPVWDLTLGIGLLLVGIWAVQKMTAKLFRLGLLLYGKPPSPREVLHWLRAA